MRTFRLHSLTAGIALGLCLLISTPVDAQSHRRGSNNTVQNRDNKSNNRKSQADNNSGRRPGVSSTGNRNNKDNNPGKKKEQPGNNNSRPENKPSNGNSNVRPQPKPQPKPQPRPGNHNNHYDNRPKWNGHIAPPARPYRPKYRPMPHIAPPPYWRPHHNAPIINGVLGLTFGTLYHATLDYLYSHDYIVDGYTNNILYLRDVAQFNYHWQDVMLNYNNGRLANINR